MFLLLCATAFFAYLRRKSRRRGWYPEHVGRDPSGIDDCKEHNYVAVPFQSPPGSAQPTSFTQPPIGYVGRATKGDRAAPAVPQEPHHVVSGASPTSDTGVWQAGVAIALIRRMRMQKADRIPTALVSTSARSCARYRWAIPPIVVSATAASALAALSAAVSASSIATALSDVVVDAAAALSITTTSAASSASTSAVAANSAAVVNSITSNGVTATP
ncbi:hypothetical protein FRC09_004327 [Ceratobasidium sp. 395]|nr:hypothetical protein FRC09_004327 [Ceratobasidium sp. 395]